LKEELYLKLPIPNMMKKILIPTDFSAPAENAAHYAIALAKVVKGEVILCNAFKVPAEAPMAAQVAWPLLDYTDMQSFSTSELDKQIEKLTNPLYENKADVYCPVLSYQSTLGTVCDVVDVLVKEKQIDLVVMGMAGAGGLVQFILGSNSRAMIERLCYPVLFVPYEASFEKIRKIVFATDLSSDDLKPLKFLIDIAASCDATIVVMHITDFETQKDEEDQQVLESFFDKVSAKINYPKVRYEYVWNTNLDNGLAWVAEQKDVDMIAIVHHQHLLIDRVFNGSHTQKLARRTQIPLLVFPPNERLVF
jgi:nucleotide-binding universal stress UspA family protein